MCTAVIKKTPSDQAKFDFSDLEAVRDVWNERVKTIAHRQLFWHMVHRSLTALTQHQYTKFDALTTSNCCHGINTLAFRLITSLTQGEIRSYLSLSAVKKDGTVNLNYSYVPVKIIALSSLYLLTEISEVLKGQGRRTVAKRLRSVVFSIGSKFSDKIVSRLQKCFSNLVALRYSKYGRFLDVSSKISNLPIRFWQKFVGKEYLRTDRRKVMYAPTLFSMQITLAFLAKIRAKIVVMNDLIDSTGKLEGRLIRILEANEQHQFFPLSDGKIQNLPSNEPLLVFSGFAKSNKIKLNELINKVDHWMQGRLSELCLANDIHYPQFPTVSTDVNFDSTPIDPKHSDYLELFERCSKVRGVSFADPSLFALSHIFIASVAQVREYHTLLSSIEYTPANILAT